MALIVKSLFCVRGSLNILAPKFRTVNKVKSFFTSATSRSDQNKQDGELSGFGRAFVNHTKLINPQPVEEKNLSFPTMLRHSKLMQLGDPQGKIVEGIITHVVGDDLYIDFGGKFSCVCQRPQKNGRDFVRGARVKLRLEQLELSSKFLGASKELSLKEADGLLLGVLRTKGRKPSM